jgi:hypothetical protein
MTAALDNHIAIMTTYVVTECLFGPNVKRFQQFCNF